MTNCRAWFAGHGSFGACRRRGLYLCGLVPVLLLLGACSDSPPRDYTGDADRFVIEGRITDVGDNSIHLEVASITQADGDAVDWFTRGETEQIHDNYHTGSGQEDVGLVYRDGTPAELDDLSEDETVQVIGRIRDNKDGKSWNQRAVYDTIRSG